MTWAWVRIWSSFAREKKDIKGKPLKNNAKRGFAHGSLHHLACACKTKNDKQSP